MIALVERLFETGNRSPDWPMDLPDRMELRTVTHGWTNPQGTISQ